GFNVSGARSRHEGVEAALDWQASDTVGFSLAGSWTRHTYDFSFDGRGQAIVDGNDIDTAPRWLAAGEVRWQPAPGWRWDTVLRYVGQYYLDPGNRFEYPGHVLLDLRAFFEPAPGWRVAARLDNALDARYADRADYAMGDYRYLPGRGRALFVELRRGEL
ncbi:MAG: TonB-dependent receptor, partial [Xanthomonadales bacterium]|nr:TonB-dependent receptor [Xanthomonadales bacterium]